MRGRALSIGLLLAALGPLPSLAATLSVPAGYGTIQAALNVAAPGDTIEVNSGTYGEKLVFPVSGLPGAPIVLEAKPGAPTRPVIDGAGVTGANMILIDSRSHVAVLGLEIRNNLDVNDGSGIRILGEGAGIEIRDNVIHDMRGRHAMAITVYGTEPAPISDLVIEDNEIYDCEPAASEALAINGNVDGFSISRNSVRDVNNIGIVMIGGERDIQPDSTLVARHGSVRGNTVKRARSIYGGGFAAGIYVDGGRDIVIENNVVTESDLGIEIGAENTGLVAQNVIVRNNLVYRNDKAGIAFGGYAASVGRANQNVFRGNTLYDNNRVPAGEGEFWIQFAGNNLITDNLVVAGGPAAENLAIASFEGSVGNAFDHNLYYTLDGGPASLQLNGAEYAGLAAWQAGTSQDVHSIAVDPQLGAPLASDFHLTASSPAVGAGDPSYVPAVGETDIDGATRRVGTVVDVGADELTCGDGTTNVGEECDDGNLVNGDGCDENCTLTACGNGVVTASTGEQCDDGNVAPGDCCSAACVFEAVGAPCDDGARCSLSDACNGAGACIGSQMADPLCAPAGAGSAALKLRTGRSPLVSWRWAHGAAGALADLGDPTAGTDITLCIYASGGPGDRIVLEATAPTGPAWTGAAGRFKFRSADGLPNGLRTVQLHPGEPGHAKLKAQGKGPALAFETLAFGSGSSLRAQLRSSAGGCYDSAFSPPYKHDDATSFQDRSD